MPAVPEKLQLEAARAALIAVHAAAGLAVAGGHRTAARALRAAEGLTRSAIALLAAPSPEPPACATPAAAPAAGSDAAPRRPRRPRGRRAEGSGEGTGGKGDAGGGLAPGGEALMDVCSREPAEGAVEPEGELRPELLHPVFVAAGGGAAVRRHPPQLQAPSPAPGPTGSADGAGRSAASTPAPSSTSASRRRFCSCGYAQPLPRSGRCEGCHWHWTGPRGQRGVPEENFEGD